MGWETAFQQFVRDTSGPLNENWRVCEQSGRIRLTRQAGTRRKTMTLRFDWTKEGAKEALTELQQAARLVKQGLNFEQAFTAAQGTEQAKDLVSWLSLANEFERWKKQHSGVVAKSTWEDGYQKPIARAVELLDNNQSILSVEQVVAEVASGWVAGSRQRERIVGSLTQFFAWAVRQKRVHPCWSPTYDKKEIIGSHQAGRPKKSRKADPLPDRQLVQLLNSIRTKKDEEWMHNAIWLMAVYGLRPAELNHLGIKTDPMTGDVYAWCGYWKKSGSGQTMPRRLFELPPNGINKDWMGLLESHNACFRDVSRECDRVLVRRISLRPWWIAERERLSKQGLNLTAYSLRHSYSLRGHSLGIPPGKMAHAMGHTLAIHCKSYPYAEESSTLQAFQRAKLL